MVAIERAGADRAIIIGSGLAGLSAALELGNCTVVTKTALGDGASRHAQGGIAAAVGPDDTPALHADDTVAVGGGLTDPQIARLITAAAGERIGWLQELGARFDATERAGGAGLEAGLEPGPTAPPASGDDGDQAAARASGDDGAQAAALAPGRNQAAALTSGRDGDQVATSAPGPDQAATLAPGRDGDQAAVLALGQEAGHTRRRIVHANGDATGTEVIRTLVAAVRLRPDIEVAEHTHAIDLVRVNDRIGGVLVADAAGERRVLLADAVVLATGGIGRLYAHTTNPVEATGDGLAMAIRAGAQVRDPEFVQFHPTALASHLDPLPLLTEALRGDGAHLIDATGHRYVRDVHPDAELAPRDVVARANWHAQQRGPIYLDATPLGPTLPERFPTVFAFAAAAGIDPRIEPLPVTPAQHYHMGGVATDADGRSSLDGLFACGEVASTGLHGANRLASNSLVEGLVVGARVAHAIATESSPTPPHTRTDDPAGAHTRTGDHAQPRTRARAHADNHAQTRAHADDHAQPRTRARAHANDHAQTRAHADDRTHTPAHANDHAGARTRARARGRQVVAVAHDGLAVALEDDAEAIAQLRSVLWQRGGLVRDAAGLRDGLAEVAALQVRLSRGVTGRNLATVARIILEAALERRESRGSHYRADHPKPATGVGRHTVMTPSAEPVARLSTLVANVGALGA